MEKILEIKGLSKQYKDIKAVDDVSFFIKPGEILGLLGPNGAGKTTTINMITGVLEQTSGVIEVLGKNLKEHRSELLKQMNFSAVYASVPGNLTVWQNLYVFGLLYEVPNLKEKIKTMLVELELEKFEKTKVGLLSSGEQTRVNLGKAMLNAPKLLLLDEPTASLDPSSAQFIREKVKSYASGNQNGVLWTSHNMHEVEAVCDRVLFLSKGKILLGGDPKTLPSNHGKKNLEELFITVAREPLSLEIYE